MISRTRVSFVGLAVLGAILLVASGQAASDDDLARPIITGGPPVQLQPVADGMTAPNWGTVAPGDPGRLYVSDQDGILWAVDLATGNTSVFLDLSSRLVALGAFGPGTFDERGFLGVAFHPDYASNGLLYTYTSEPASGPADFSTMPVGTMPNHQSVVLEWRVPEPGNPDSVVDPATARELFRIDEPQFNHNAGGLNFGPDGMLYISLGDGGNRDDEGIGHVPGGNGQEPGNVLGSILRIDPLGTSSANGAYGTPADNPFAGDPDAADEVFAFGFRNPFRFSFDRAAGDLYVGDVGQGSLEEVDVVVGGGNYGWRLKEGSFCFEPNGAGPGFAFEADPCPGVPAGAELVDPVAEYNTSSSLEDNEGRAVVGGFVYRGSAIPALVGRYVFGDYTRITETGVNNDGRLFALVKKDIVGPKRTKTSRIFELSLADRDRVGLAVLGFGQDASGELYLLGNETGVPFGDTGVVLKIVPAH